MDNVVPFERRETVPLREDLVADLVERGSVVVDVDETVVAIVQWRALARTVGRQLGRPIRTGVHPSGTVMWAALGDWPATDDERARQQTARRRAVQAASGKLD